MKLRLAIVNLGLYGYREEFMTVCLGIGQWLKEFGTSFIEKLIEEFKIGDIGEEINHGILQWKSYFTLGEFDLLITDAIIVTWIAVLLGIILCRVSVSKLNIIPNKKQTLMEMIVELIISSSMSFGLSREQAERIMPMIGTMGLMITCCDVISIFKISPPAKNIAFPIALALFAIIYVIVMSISFVGLKGFWNSLIHPIKFMLPFKLLDYVIKPMSLALRLFGNVFGAFVFMEFVHIICPILLPGVLSLWFDLADGILQAVVFSYLTMSYIGEIVESANSVEEEMKHKPKKEKKLKKNKNTSSEANVISNEEQAIQTT